MYSNTGKQTWDWISWGICTDKDPPKDNKAFFKITPVTQDKYVLEDQDGNVLRLTRYGIHWGVPYTANKEFMKTDTTNDPTSLFDISFAGFAWKRFLTGNIAENLTTCPAEGNVRPKSQANNPTLLQSSGLQAGANGETEFTLPTQTFSQTFSLYGKTDIERTNFDEMFRDRDKSLRGDRLDFISGVDNTIHKETLLENKSKKPLLTNKPKFPPLPPDFKLTDEWIQRLYDINMTTDSSLDLDGICGTCLLQAYQMIGELLENHNQPRTSGGYFFDTAHFQNPLISFRARNSLLSQTLSDILGYYNTEVGDHTSAFRRKNDRLFASSISMLSQHFWTMYGPATERGDIEAVLQTLLDAPVGSIFLVSFDMLDAPARRSLGHAQMALRLSEGVVLVPANAGHLTLEQFRARLTPHTTRGQIARNLAVLGGQHVPLIGIAALDVRREYYNGYEHLVSFNNCTGEGDDRRGNGLAPTRFMVNQCGATGGRCLW